MLPFDMAEAALVEPVILPAKHWGTPEFDQSTVWIINMAASNLHAAGRDNLD